jgi:hypothetical protein
MVTTPLFFVLWQQSRVHFFNLELEDLSSFFLHPRHMATWTFVARFPLYQGSFVNLVYVGAPTQACGMHAKLPFIAHCKFQVYKTSTSTSFFLLPHLFFICIAWNFGSLHFVVFLWYSIWSGDQSRFVFKVTVVESYCVNGCFNWVWLHPCISSLLVLDTCFLCLILLRHFMLPFASHVSRIHCCLRSVAISSFYSESCSSFMACGTTTGGFLHADVTMSMSL